MKSARAIPDSDGNPLFIAADVMAALDYPDDSDITEAIKHIPEEWRGVRSVLTLDGVQKMDVLTEEGLYFFMGPSLSR